MILCYSTLTRNIRHRRGEKVVINVPSECGPEEGGRLRCVTALTLTSLGHSTVFRDKNTPSPFVETFPEDNEAARAAKPDHIYMDAMGFGMGNCCLQVLLGEHRLAKGP